ncbi:GTP 3',8-cyclase MoaA [Gudongella sp. SC589]|jgi:cyclic pyranopterin phosphate synthase|uniref:GTP 3',8-cyclase MoaA n=1 Tax=Gudongella sp. SC589 TaxID=3385990 RepID=UPI003904B0F2
MRDRFGRDINYLRISLTDRCNLRCEYCMPEDGIKNKIPHCDMLSLEELYEITEAFVSLGINKIRFTGGEPLVREGAVDLIKRVNALEGVREVTLTTNGILLDDYLDELLDAGVKRLNISLDTLDPVKYMEITRGGDIARVLKAIGNAKAKGIKPIKINTVLIGGFNDDEIPKLVGMTRDGGVDVRFIELMPIGEAAGFARSRFISNEEILRRIPELVEVDRDDPSSPATYYKLPEGKGKVGLINPISCKFCTNCNRVRLTATGKLKLCLHSNREIDLKKVLRNGENLEKAISEAILTKEEEHHLEDQKYITRNMNQIGG